MEIEIKEIYNFLKDTIPFKYLNENEIKLLSGNISIRYFKRKSRLDVKEIKGSYIFILRSGSAEARSQDDLLLDVLDIKSLFYESCLVEQEISYIMFSEDSLLYCISCEEFDKFLKSSEPFESFIKGAIQKQMKYVNEASENTNKTLENTMVKEAISSKIISVTPNTSIKESAAIMKSNNVSSLIIYDNTEIYGIATDRDLRNSCLAEGLSSEQNISKIMSRIITTIDVNASLWDALMLMTKNNVHHLPVLIKNKLTGMITLTDIMKFQFLNPAGLVSNIYRANSIEALQEISLKIPEMEIQMKQSGFSGKKICESVSGIADAITIRLIQFFENKNKISPVPFVWAAGGSQGRKEMLSGSDQDHIMIISNECKESDLKYFKELSQYVSDGLNECGFVYCPGDAMATNPKWRKTLADWENYFKDWIEKPEKTSVMNASIFFDLRPVYGDTTIFRNLQTAVVNLASQNQIFLVHMAANILTRRPPLGIFQNFLLERNEQKVSTFDIKHKAIIPIVDIARFYALAGGLIQVNTAERIEAACIAGQLSAEMKENLLHSMEYLTNLRVGHHCAQLKENTSPDNNVNPALMSDLERKHLKNIFRIIKTMQDFLENRYQLGRLI